MAWRKGLGKNMRRALYPRAWPVVALFALVALGLLLWPGEGRVDSVRVEEASADVGWGSLTIGGNGVDGLAVALSGKALSGYESDPPVAARNELPLLADALCSADSDGVIVGFTLDGTLDSSSDRVREEMEKRGWTYVSSGNQTAATFAKDVGIYRWAAATCTEVNSGVSVVINARGSNV